MKWFQHDTNALYDAKIKRLILRHGAEGYAIYFHCLELIGGDISKDNITFELEHDSEIIADNLKIKGTKDESGIDKVNRIMKDIIELNLFQLENNRIICYKLAKRLDNTISRSPEINSIKEKVKKNVDPTKLLRRENKAEEIRVDKITLDKNKLDIKKEQQTVCDLKSTSKGLMKLWCSKMEYRYCPEKNKTVCLSWFNELKKMVDIEVVKKGIVDAKKLVNFRKSKGYYPIFTNQLKTFMERDPGGVADKIREFRNRPAEVNNE